MVKKYIERVIKREKSLISDKFIDQLEDVVHGFLGIMLFIISGIAAGFSLYRLVNIHPFFPVEMIQGINHILIVVIILEIMRTLIMCFTDGIFQLDNFLIIGVIAAVRRTE